MVGLLLFGSGLAAMLYVADNVRSSMETRKTDQRGRSQPLTRTKDSESSRHRSHPWIHAQSSHGARQREGRDRSPDVGDRFGFCHHCHLAATLSSTASVTSAVTAASSTRSPSK